LRRKGRIHWCKTRTLLPDRSILQRTAGPYVGSASADIRHAAVNDDLAAGSERRFVRGEEDHRSATSLGRPIRPAEIWARSCLRWSSVSPSCRGVAMVPGLTELTRMPRPMSSPEGVRAIEAMPALVAQLETWLGPPKAGRPDLSRVKGAPASIQRVRYFSQSSIRTPPSLACSTCRSIGDDLDVGAKGAGRPRPSC